MNENVFPLGKRVLAAEIKKEHKSESGIVLTSSTTVKETSAARILAVGPEVEKIKAGDVVYLDWAKTKLIVIDAQQRVLLEEEDVMAVIA